MIPADAPIATADRMRAAEEAAFRHVAQQDVMERAGAAVARETARFAQGRPILVLAGPGNNGGDAYVAARLLRDQGHDVVVAACGEPGTAAARAMHARWGGEVASLYQARPRAVVIDGLFGTGLTRPLERGIAPVLAELVGAAEFALAIDLPSGLATDSGADLGAPRGITATLALGALKPAHVLDAGLERCGNVLLADIGVSVDTPWRTLARPRLAAPSARAHKFSRGLVLVVEGAMPGAARLAARAAMAGGAGYTILAGADPGDGAPDALVRHQVADGDELSDLLGEQRVGALLVGPGLGRDRRAEGLLKAALGSDAPLVLDGDALTLLGTSAASWLQRRTAVTFLTPHSGEFHRMFETPGDKIGRTLAAAAAARATVVHKGADTVIASPRGEVRVLARASSWLSTAGSGDVLAGILAAQLATGHARPAEAAAWLHARAAALAGPAFFADALPMHVPQAIAECL
jgi:ADP-dependent NAD(P)H-hydrate dehydratase / NAD(P)H-hydrate epimerase